MENYRLSYCFSAIIIILLSNIVYMNAFEDADYDGGEVQNDIRFPDDISKEMKSRFSDFSPRKFFQHTKTGTKEQNCPPYRKQVLNAALNCKMTSCKATCMKYYQFPNGKSEMYLRCSDGEWMITDSEWTELPGCEPICLPQCQNSGICISPGQCQCPENFLGPQCQHEKKLCLTQPPPPMNSRRSCTSSQCTITCLKGYRFPDGTSVLNLACKNGDWMPTRPELTAIPDCQPTCTPACQNGGNCLSYNTCQCPPDFRGTQCQYSVETCSPKKLRFNGGYNCSATGTAVTCTIYCPAGVNFNMAPASRYVCDYSLGIFEPAIIPTCVFGEGMELVPTEQKSKTHFKDVETFKHHGHGRKKKMKHDSNSNSHSSESDEDDDESWEKVITKIKIKGKGKAKGKGKPKKLKEPKKGKYYDDDEDEEENANYRLPGVYNLYLSKNVDVIYRTPKPAICMTWNGNKVKTFDGLVYTSPLYCSHTLIQDYVDGTFSVALRACPFRSEQPCAHALEIFLQSMQYTLENTKGKLKLYTPKKELPIPVQLPGIRITMVGHNVKIDLEAVQLGILWDKQQFITVEASAGLWNRTAGLCGTLDQDINNDFRSKLGVIFKAPATFIDSWKTPELDADKFSCIMEQNNEENQQCKPDIQERAIQVCTKLFENSKLTNCLSMFDKSSLLTTCITDYCSCSNVLKPEKCACDGVSVLAKDCIFRGIKMEHGWRDLNICPVQCNNGRIFKSCGPSFEPSCGSTTIDKIEACQEGCFCPTGTIQHDGLCIDPEECPCTLRGKTFEPKSEITKDCNTCTCQNGKWKCTDVTCGARCSAVGDPHYATFDGRRFDFMGKCSYYLLKTANFSVEAENVACPGSISESMNLPAALTADMPSCTKSVTIHIKTAGKEKNIKLKQGRMVLIDGLEVSQLPKELFDGAIKIRQASSTITLVDFEDGLKVWWDGMTRVYIDAPPSYRGKTKGLCGTFNSNMVDDFLTPEEDIESSVEAFADKWRTKDTCDYLSDSVAVPHPCQLNMANKAKAEKYCKRIHTSEIFEDCHWSVDPASYYEDCLYDVCACQGEIELCMCPILSAYATECARQGVILDWRYNVKECAIKCPAGQIFEQCGESCTRTCSDLQINEKCKTQCVEGCRCPRGQVLDDHNECVPIGMCPCVYKGLTFNPGYKEVRPGQKYLELCTCSGAKWTCNEAKDDDKVKYPPAADLRSRCLATKHEEFTTCEPAEPITCRNMHEEIEVSTAECRPGCVCKKGYVLDSGLKQCVLPKDCSCHHGGKSYTDGEKIQEDCNQCTCQGGKWECTTQSCPSVCTAWGDSHFETYDGKDFDFQGVCDYVLSKGTLADGTGFSITIQNVLCGSLGVTCSKSVTISILGPHAETIVLSSDSPIPKISSIDSVKRKTETSESGISKKVSINRAGVFVVVETPGLGMQVKWDRGTRVYVKLDNRWKGRVQGLCGNYNGDAQDDLKTPSSGIETSPVLFGHAWKLQDYCSMPTEPIDACAKHVERKTWSQRKCGILKSEVFKPCHTEVPVEKYLKNCIFDTCACDQGGDCECLCTALAAYAHACSAKGVPIAWRTPELCPMQCDPKCSHYSPCISACPVETCDNILDQAKDERMCKEDTCVEGCLIKDCPENTIYFNDTYSECTAKAICKPVCLEMDGVIYYEGDKIPKDDCQTCHCSRGKEVCSGTPCEVTIQESLTTIQPMHEDTFKCVSGWSNWMNQDKYDLVEVAVTKTKSKPKKQLKNNDIEPIPSYFAMKNVEGFGACEEKLVSIIECRTVGSHNTPKSTGEDVECSLERGLLCSGECHDYEIRVFCNCATTSTGYDEEVPRRKTPKIIDDFSKPIDVEFITTPWTKKITPLPPKPTLPPYKHSIPPFLPTVSPYVPSLPPYKPVKPTTVPSKLISPEQCDFTVPHVEFEGDCYKFLHCAPHDVTGEWRYVEKTCGPTMMFNPKAMVCDWIDTVVAMKPSCGFTTPYKPIASTVIPPKLISPKQCDFTVPHVEFEGDCYKFLHCAPHDVTGEWRYVEKTCGPTMMYNPKAMVCDWIDTVVAMKPSCGFTTPYKPIASTVIPPKLISPEQCDFTVPHVEFEGDCYKFLHCAPHDVTGEWRYVEKTCGPTMMFNPKAMVCDWIDTVVAMKPSCGEIKKTTPSTLDQAKCPPGQIWSECAYPCGRSCHYYEKELFKYGHCKVSSNECVPDCVNKETNTKCPVNYLWRDKTSCVISKDCPCMNKKGKIVKPGEVFKESDCEICQCLNNAYVCTPQLCDDKIYFEIPTTAIEEEIYEPVFTTTEKIHGKPTKPAPLTSPSVIIIPSTVTPPMQCIKTNIIPLIDGLTRLPDNMITASSTLGSYFEPYHGRLSSKPTSYTSGSWSPKINDQMQYLQISFPKPTPLFGIVTSGSPSYDQYVTSFKILHSFDGVAFHYLVDETGTPQIFRGPIAPRAQAQDFFKIPIESKVIRIYPLTWHERIAMRVELLGCLKEKAPATPIVPIIPAKTTIIPLIMTPSTVPKPMVTTPKPYFAKTTPYGFDEEPMCDDPMGIENGKMSPNQIKSSSIKPSGLKTGPIKLIKQVSMTSSEGWMPMINSPNEFLEFDFLEPRNLTGVKTKGGKKGWITAYEIEYSNDDYNWNKFYKPDGSVQIFSGNYDGISPHVNYFTLPLHARHLKLLPTKWNNNIELMAEPLGCFKPYPFKEDIISVVTLPPDVKAEICAFCPGIPETLSFGACNCYEPKYWDGGKCVPRYECPCMVGHMVYEIGAHYQTEDCSNCICTLGGVSQCSPHKCPPCKDNLHPIKSASCMCLCEACPEFTKICPTSGVCVPEESWCDGILDCPDDEIDCPKFEISTALPTITEPPSTISKECPTPSCHPGYKIKEKYNTRKMSQMFESGIKSHLKTSYTKSAYKKTPIKYSSYIPVQDHVKQSVMEDECIEFICVPETTTIFYPDPKKCPKPTCPPGYEIIMEKAVSTKSKDCAKYTCEPPPQNDAICNATGRTFTTFDGTEFKIDICNHILARDLSDDAWTVVLRKNCDAGNFICVKEIEIRDRELGFTIILNANHTVNLDGYLYTVAQLQNSPLRKSFVVSKVGDYLVFISKLHGFWVTMDQHSDVKIGVSRKYFATVDGLCGYFNGIPEDDKRLPDGELAKNTIDFGESWLITTDKDALEACQPHACPKHLQDIAWNMCNLIRQEDFEKCLSVVDVDRFIGKCLETACECLQTTSNSVGKMESKSPEAQQCKCSMLQNYVGECMAADESVLLDNWRTIHSCEIPCVAPLVHHDCYRRRCEKSCETLSIDDCPHLTGTCFSGCYCPEGMVRKAGKCVPVSECRDCVCDNFGKSKYVTYDRHNFTLDGKCTYVLSQDISLKDIHTFQVYVTVDDCESKVSGVKTTKKRPETCTQALHIAHGEHIIHIQKSKDKTFDIIIDGMKISKLPIMESWVELTNVQNKELKLILKDSQVEIDSMFEDMSFSIRVPSLTFGSKLEGLCGDCNNDPSNDLSLINKQRITKKEYKDPVKKFVSSWLSKPLKDGADPETCIAPEEVEAVCMPLPPEKDPCFKILDEVVFGQCHLVVNPLIYVEACQKDMCVTGPVQKGACEIMAAYARDCARNGICINWRNPALCPFDCPANLEYKPCGCPETCESIKAKNITAEKLIGTKSSPIKSKIVKDVCYTDQIEGCFCPKNMILKDGTCIKQELCSPCDDKGHVAGDEWHPDVCTKCKCAMGGITECSVQSCPEAICDTGMELKEIPISGECCKKIICVSKPTTMRPVICPPEKLPECGPDQINKVDTDADGCPKYICECKPKSECDPIMTYSDLKPGEIVVNDTTGCCPKSEVLCDKSLCPEKPTKCVEEFYEVVKVEPLPDQCCKEYKCVSPKDKCLVNIKGKKMAKKVNEKWPTDDPCVSKMCVYGPSGVAIVHDEIDVCLEVCKIGFEMQPIPGKCCGKCVQTKCVLGETVYMPGDTWFSADNCTTFNCNVLDNTYYIASSAETCPDVSDCPIELLYKDKCCEKCKPAPLSQVVCAAETLPETTTVGMVYKLYEGHGLCKNVQPIRGFTECHGTCKSGTFYNPLTLQQDKKCDCCHPDKHSLVSIKLSCDDGFTFYKDIPIPTSCSCQLCGEEKQNIKTNIKSKTKLY